MRTVLIRLKRWFTLGNIVCLLTPAFLTFLIVVLYKSGLLDSDGIFIILLLLLISVGATLAISNLGKSGVNWIQGTALIASTAAVFAACGQIATLPHSANLIDNANSLLNQVGITSLNGQWVLFVIFIILLFIVMAYIYILTVFGVGERNLEEEALRRALNQRIYDISDELDWSVLSRKDSSKKEVNRFTSMDVSVEKREGNKNRKQYSDLIKCIRKNRKKGRIFLLKGDPGSGKSVALRKLSVSLSNDNRTIPIYINLKKWKNGWEIDEWKKEEKEKKIRQFVIDSIEEEIRGNEDQALIKEIFLKHINERSCFFLMDSFDEIPCILGIQNPEPLIADISKSLYYFMNTNGQGGIVASREYHSPSSEIGADIVLWIQEFDEIRIRKMILRYLPQAGKAVWKKLVEREDMIAICKNPFHLTLLINYMMDSINVFPEKQMDLYEGFINHSLKSIGDQYSIDIDLAIKKGIQLALFLQNMRQYELPVSSLPEYITQSPNIISAFEKARICRLGGGDEAYVTFSHRRFQEYFLVRNMVECNTECSKEIKNSILGYTDLRDAYVLYCEVADVNIVSEIAAFCWKTVRDNFDLKEDEWDWHALVNTLFFMSDAFHRRSDIKIVRTEEFENIVMSMIEETTDFVIRLALVHCMVLFSQNNLQKYVLDILNLGNRWYDEAVMKNCRKLQKVKPEVESAFYLFFQKMSLASFFKRFHNIHFILSISKQFKMLRIRHSMLAIKYILEILLLLSIVLVGSYIRILPTEMYVVFRDKYYTHFTDVYWNEVFLSILRIILPICNYLKVDVSAILIIPYEIINYFMSIVLAITLFGDVLKHLHKEALAIYSKYENTFMLGSILLAAVSVLSINYYLKYANWDMHSLYMALSCIVLGISCFDYFRDRDYTDFSSYIMLFVPRDIAMCLVCSCIFILINNSNIGMLDIFNKGMTFVYILFLSLITILCLYRLIKYLLLKRADTRLISEIRDLLNRDGEPCIDRSIVAKTLSDLKTEKGKIDYTELLIEKNATFQGSWPDDFSVGEDEDIVIHNLSLLNYKGTPVGKRIS